MNQNYCVALVFSRHSTRYTAYAIQYTEALMALHKHVIIVSPNCLALQQELLVKFRTYTNKMSFVPIDEYHSTKPFPNRFNLVKRLLKLRLTLNAVEQKNQTKIDLVFFAPVDDWIKPNFGKWMFRKIFPYSFSGLLTQTAPYKKGLLKLNVDPKYWEFDYLLSNSSCVGVCTLDRFETEKIRSRVYRKVLVMPDCTFVEGDIAPFEFGQNLRKMANNRMLIGTILYNDYFPSSLIELVISSPSEAYFFVLIGEISPKALNHEQRELLQKLISSGKTNFYLKMEVDLSHEEENSLLRTFDVIFVGHTNLNMPDELLTRAAKFNIPVVSAENTNTAKLVDTFKLGVVAGTSSYETLDALEVLRMQLPFALNFNFEPMKTYSKLQSRDYLIQTWEELLWF